MPKGRPNKGIEHAMNTHGDSESKRKLKLILATITGELSVKQACAELGVSETRFQTLRAAALQGAVDALAPRPAGRPRKVSQGPDADFVALREENARLKQRLQQERQIHDLHRNLDALGPQSERKGVRKRRGELR